MNRELTYKNYFDKVYGAWIGKCIGGAAGAPVEGFKSAKKRDMRELLNGDLPNDDLDIQLLWLTVLEGKGPYFTANDLAKAWLERCWYPFGEYGYFLKNYMRGIRPPYSGWFNNSYFSDGMGCPIRSEIWALISPGQVDLVSKMAEKDASLDHAGNSYWGEIFLAVLESMAFFSDNIHDLIEQALKHIKVDNKLKRCISMVLEKEKDGAPFEDVRKSIVRDFSHPDFTNCVQNIGYTILSLLYGQKDMEKTINLTLECGYDADCTAATAGAIVGIINGASKIDNELKSLLMDKFVCGIDVQRPDDTIYTLAKNTCAVGAAFSEIHKDVRITEKPDDIEVYEWQLIVKDIDINVQYKDMPAIGFDDKCEITVIVKNNTPSTIMGILMLSNIPKGIDISVNNISLELEPYEERLLDISFMTSKEIAILSQTNIIEVEFNSNDNKYITEFGIAGAISWRVTGPFIEPGKDNKNDKYPCHPPETMLPGVVALFSNSADPDYEYLNESSFIESVEKYPVERYINAYEDLIPVDESFGLEGEATFYLATDLYFEDDCERWVVLGNSDAFKIWINGQLIKAANENRVWQPCCYGEVVNFKKGYNRIILKLTKRSKDLSFSFGIRRFEGNHYHRMKWETKYGCIKID